VQELEAKRLSNEMDSKVKANFLSMSPEMNDGNPREEILQSGAHT